MVRHFSQKSENVLNGRLSSSTTSHGSYSKSALKEHTDTPSADKVSFARLSLTSDIGSKAKHNNTFVYKPSDITNPHSQAYMIKHLSVHLLCQITNYTKTHEK